MRTSELQTALQALDHLPMPDKSAALRRVNAYAKAGIAALDPPAYPLPTPHPPLLRRPALSAAVALTLVGIGAGSMLGADLYTYEKAADFFADYGLSTEGLERGDLWAVYRDIIEGSFSLSDTAWMLQSNMGITPSGSLSAEEAESLWEGWKEDHAPTAVTPLDVSYYIRVTHHDRVSGHSQKTARPHDTAFFTPNPTAEEEIRSYVTDFSDTYLGPEIRDIPYSYSRDDNGTIHFMKRKGGQTVWTIPLDGLDSYIQYTGTDDYVAVTGETAGESPNILLYLISPDGEILWSRTLDNGETQELPQYILFGEDTVTLFSWTDRIHICRSVFDLSGNLLENSISTLEKGPVYTIQQAIPFREGHLLLMNHTDTDTSLYYMNAQGIITDSYGFEDGGGLGIPYTEGASGVCAYTLTVDRILEANGYLYISLTGTSEERLSNVCSWCIGYWENAENSWLGSEIFSGNNYGIPQNELANRIRTVYRSFLLVCDPETMEPLSVTVMDGAYAIDHKSSLFGSSISVNQDGSLTWEVESPYATIFSPCTSSFSIAGSSYAYFYTLTPDGKIIDTPIVAWGSGYRE